LSERSDRILETPSRFGVVRITYPNPASGGWDIQVIRLEPLDDYDMKVRLRINGKYYNGIVEMTE
tara:strand:+ start:40 stop:234 length:195 start_codon:yes stop_codon:yes gene_type:complete